MVCGRRGCKGKEGEGKERERKGKEGKGRERKGKKDGKGRKKEGKGRERKGKKGKGRERKGKEGKGMSGKRSRWRSASLAARTAADGVGVRVAGNGGGEEAAGDERAWLRGRLRTAWVPGSGWKWVGRRSRWRSASLAARTAADGKWVRRIARTAADGVGATEWLEMGGEQKPLMSKLGCADGCGREMDAENCADGCGRRGCNGVAGNGWGEEAAGDERARLRGRLRTANGCGELCGRLRSAWLPGSGWKWVGRRSRWRSASLAADGSGRQMGAENCADSCGRRGCQGVAGNGWGEEAAGDERAWLRGRLRTANGWGELRGRLRTVWVPAYMGMGFAKYLQQFWELLSPVVSMMYVSYILY